MNAATSFSGSGEFQPSIHFCATELAADTAACEGEIVESSPKLVAAVAAAIPVSVVRRVILAILSSTVMHTLSEKLLPIGLASMKPYWTP